jgi:FkbM family methyltransferase
MLQRLRKLARRICELDKIKSIQEEIQSLRHEVRELNKHLQARSDRPTDEMPKPLPLPPNLSNPLIALLTAASADAWFRVRLNGVPLELPRYTLKTMQHCMAVDGDGSISLLVEYAHWCRMRDQLMPGSLFLDVGAATGAMCVPYALSLKGVRVVAFEPSRRANSYLAQTIQRNRLAPTAIELLPFAISSSAATLDFMEIPEDATGNVPYLPETSRIQVDGEPLYDGAERFSVDVRTLDMMSESIGYSRHEKIVIKVDVEGFEIEVLRGGIEMIRRHRPYFAIDVHMDPTTQKPTRPDVISLLKAEGYGVEEIDHVVLATPT